MDLIRDPTRTDIRFIIFGYEVAPTTGTPHLQGYFELSRRQRLSGLKRLPGFGRASFRACNGDAASNIAYCSKDSRLPVFRRGTPAKSPASLGGEGRSAAFEDALVSARRGDLDSIPAWIRLCHHGAISAIAEDGLWERAARRIVHRPLVLRPWQREVVDIIEKEPSDRTIYVVLDRLGNAGKTTLCDFLAHEYPVSYSDLEAGAGNPRPSVQILHPSRGVDMARFIRPASVYILDIPRATGEAVPWAMIEHIKNGNVFSSKYDPIGKRMPRPHVFIFTNDEVEPGRFSADRLFYIYTE